MTAKTTAAAVPVTRVGDGVLSLRNGQFAALVELQGVLFGLLPREAQDQVLLRWLHQVLMSLEWPVTLVALPERVDLRGAVAAWGRRRDAGAIPPALAEGFRRLLDAADAGLERYTYLAAVAGPTPSAAADRGQALVHLLAAADPGLQPVLCGTDRAVELLAQAFGRELPAPASAYLRAPSVAATAPLEPPAPPAPRRGLLRRRRAAAPAPASALTLDAPAGPWPAAPGLMDLVAPAAWQEFPDAVQLGPDLWARTFTAVAYPPEAFTGFLDPLLHVPVPRRFAWHLTPLDTAAAVATLTRRIQAHRTSLTGALREGRPADPYREQRLREAQALQDELVANRTKLFALRFNVTLFGASRAELAAHTQEFLRAARGSLFVFQPLTLEQAAGFVATLPVAWPAAGRLREIDAGSLACMFPATHFDVTEPDGVLLGRNLSTGGIAQVDLLDARAWPVLHALFIASTGSGKSYAMKTLLTQLLADADRPCDVVVVDPSRPIDYERWTAALQGAFVPLAAGTRHPWNLCAITAPPDPAALDPEDQRFVSQKVDFLLLILQVLARAGEPWPPTLRAQVAEVLQDVYAARGIVDDDPASLWVPDSLTVSPQLKPMPRLADVTRALAQHSDPAVQAVALALRPYVTGGLYALFDGPDAPPDTRLLVYNIERVATRAPHDPVRVAVYLALAEQVAQRLRLGGRRLVLVIDEAHYLFQHADTATWVEQLFRTARKAGGAIWLATQNITDFVGAGAPTPAGAAAQRALGNAALAWLGRQDKEAELEQLRAQFQLSDTEVAFLAGAGPGDGLWVAGRRFRLATHVLAPPTLDALIRTDLDRPEVAHA